MVEPRLKVVGLTAGYKDNPVLSGLDLEIRPGEVVVVTGSNGSGKSTMLRCLAGLMRFEGVVEVDGEPLATANRSKVGYLPQHVTFPRWARVGDVLNYFARLRGTDPTVSVFPEGFVPAQAQPVRTLSGGQRQRLALAVALLGDPSLILLDEPVASLDDASVPSLIKVIDRVAESGGSVLVTSPRHEADSLGPDRVLRLQGGLVVGGTTAPYPTPSGRGVPFPQSFASIEAVDATPCCNGMVTTLPTARKVEAP